MEYFKENFGNIITMTANKWYTSLGITAIGSLPIRETSCTCKCGCMQVAESMIANDMKSTYPLVCQNLLLNVGKFGWHTGECEIDTFCNSKFSGISELNIPTTTFQLVRGHTSCILHGNLTHIDDNWLLMVNKLIILRLWVKLYKECEEVLSRRLFTHLRRQMKNLCGTYGRQDESKHDILWSILSYYVTYLVASRISVHKTINMEIISDQMVWQLLYQWIVIIGRQELGEQEFDSQLDGNEYFRVKIIKNIISDIETLSKTLIGKSVVPNVITDGMLVTWMWAPLSLNKIDVKWIMRVIRGPTKHSCVIKTVDGYYENSTIGIATVFNAKAGNKCTVCKTAYAVGDHALPKYWPIKLVRRQGINMTIYDMAGLCEDCRPKGYTAISHSWNIHNSEKVPLEAGAYKWFDGAVTILSSCHEWIWMDQLCISDLNKEKQIMNWYFSKASTVVVLVGQPCGQPKKYGIINRLWCLVETYFARNIQLVARCTGEHVSAKLPWDGQTKTWLTVRIGGLLCGDVNDVKLLVNIMQLDLKIGDFGKISRLPGKRRDDFGWCWCPEDIWQEDKDNVLNRESYGLAYGGPSKVGYEMVTCWCDGRCGIKPYVKFCDGVIFNIYEQHEGVWHVGEPSLAECACQSAQQMGYVKLAGLL